MSKFTKFLDSFKRKSRKVSDLSAAEIEHYSEPLMVWQATSFIKFQRTKSWYIASITILTLLILLGIIIGSPTFAIAVIVFAMVYIFLTQEDPKSIDVLISDIGIIINNQVYPFTEIKTFWIEYEPPAFQALHLVLKKEFSEEITINFHGINPTNIRLVLNRFLPEWEEREKNFTENITRMLGL